MFLLQIQIQQTFIFHFSNFLQANVSQNDKSTKVY